MASIILLATLTTFVILVVGFVWRRIRLQKLREELGLRGPPTDFITGNLREFIKATMESGEELKPVEEMFKRCFEQYSNENSCIG